MFAELFILLDVVFFFAAPALGPSNNPITAMFAASDFLWLLFYVLVLASFGRAIEQKIGGYRFALVYASAGLVGNLGLLNIGAPSQMSLGAGAPLMGVIGMLAAINPLAFVVIDIFPLPAFAAAALVLVAHFMARGGIDVFPMLAGMVLGYAFKPQIEKEGQAPARGPARYGPR